MHAVCHSFISKVVVLYQRALRETKGNVGLWLRFATFCYQHGNRRLLSRVITQALQMNPSCAGLWAFAAFWEYTSQVPQRTDFSSYPSSWKAIIQALKNWRSTQPHRVMCPQHGVSFYAVCETARTAKAWSLILPKIINFVEPLRFINSSLARILSLGSVSCHEFSRQVQTPWPYNSWSTACRAGAMRSTSRAYFMMTSELAHNLKNSRPTGQLRGY